MCAWQGGDDTTKNVMVCRTLIGGIATALQRGGVQLTIVGDSKFLTEPIHGRCRVGPKLRAVYERTMFDLSLTRMRHT